jgi:hypothetical protein
MKRAAVLWAFCFAISGCGPTEGIAHKKPGGGDGGVGGNSCTKPPADTDGDGISDVNEGAMESPPVDTDGDGLPNFRDLDSDGDCIPDAVEAGDTNLMTLPVDTDNDGTPDFEDLDSDNDGLVDAKEDLNCNGVVDACETNRLAGDTDGDGISDLIEVEDCAVKPAAQQGACMCDGSNPTVSPLTLGDFVFTVDYMQPPMPSSETLSLSTNIEQADVLFVFDTTDSQGSAIAAVSTGLQGIVSTVQQKVKDIAFGVMEFRDFGDNFITQYDYRITTANTVNSPTVAAVRSAIGALAAGGGGDAAEGGWLALYSAAGGPAVSAHGYTSAINLANVNPKTPPAGESQGTLAGAGFRAGSVPILVTVSDAAWHDAYGQVTNEKDPVTMLADPHAGFDDYDSSLSGTPSRETTVHLLQGLGAHVIGVAATDASSATRDSTSRMTDTAYDTGAVVTPADFGATRPTGCAANQCCTGVSGAGIAPDGNGVCPLAFQYDDGNGNGIGDAVASGIVALANGLKFDIHVEAHDVDPGTVDNFMFEIVPNVSGTGPAAMCVVVPTAMLQDNFTGPKALPGKDMVNDTVPGVVNGKLVCFDVVAKMNTSTPATTNPQFFHATLQVKGLAPGGAMLNLGTPRDVFFLVPPKVMNGPIQ